MVFLHPSGVFTEFSSNSCQITDFLTPGSLSKALWAGQTEGEGLKISDLVFSFLNVPTGCGYDL